MNTTVTEALQVIAERIVHRKDEIREAEEQLRSAENRRAGLFVQMSADHKLLQERVGANITRRVFVVGEFVVIVEHERGVVVHKIEKG